MEKNPQEFKPEVIKCIKQDGLEDTVRKLFLYSFEHPKLPLVILNYQRDTDNQVSNQCRGLILEKKSWKVVARGITRFTHLKSLPLRKENHNDPFRAENKEDGSMIMLFHYGDSWHLACKHNFAEDYVSSGRLTYKSLFWDTIKDREKVEKVLDSMRKDVTLVFELCSLDNRVVQKYEEPQLFLLAGVFRDHIGELNSDELDALAVQLGVKRPPVIKGVGTNDQKQLLNLGALDLIEGWVVTINGVRYKKKNPFYILVHKLKFRGWSAMTPGLWNLLVEVGDTQIVMKALLEHLKDLGFHDWELEEISHLAEMYKKDVKAFKEAFIHSSDERYHMNQKYCGLEDNHEEKIIYANELSKPFVDSEGNTAVYCPCCPETLMEKKRLKRDWVVPANCHCGKRVGVYKIGTGKILYICPKCHNTHECTPIGKPLGYPCCPNTKRYRLHLHQLMDEKMEKNKWKRAQLYKWLQEQTGLPSEDAHVAKFNQQRCKDLIKSISM